MDGKLKVFITTKSNNQERYQNLKFALELLGYFEIIGNEYEYQDKEKYSKKKGFMSKICL